MADTIVSIPPLGEVKLIVPKSFSAMISVSDLLNNQEPGTESIALAACLGLCWSHENKKRLVPYKTGQSIRVYGASVIDYLIGIHEVAPGRSLWMACYQARNVIFNAVPTEPEIADTTDFSTPQQGK